MLSFGGRFASLPTQAPRQTTVHLFHGGADTAIDAFHSRAALELLAQLQGDATLDIALSRGVHVVQREFKGFGDQWNFALRTVKAAGPLPL